MTEFELEIRSQGSLLTARAAQGMREAQFAAASLGAYDYWLVAARGSSDNAAIFFQYLAARELGRVVALATPSLFEEGASISLHGAAVVAISQSGRSPGIANVAASAVAQGRPVVALTNDPTSPLALASSTVISLGTGPEKAVASTKTFTATWFALAQFISAVRGSDLAGLSDLPNVIAQTVQWALDDQLAIAALDVPVGLTVVGRGIGYAVADEIALKIREVSGVRAESFAASDYLHGPIGADGDGCALLIVVTDELSDDVIAALSSGARDAGMISVALRGPDRAVANVDAEIVLPLAAPNWLAGLQQVVVGQVLALRLGERRNRPIDTSPRLKKVTLSA
jgi:glucosamine--fructose-6-phosphate aminotransferase (isomerizing)